MASSLLQLFVLPEEKFDSDPRAVNFEFAVPNVGIFGVKMIPPLYWIQLSVLLTIGSIFSALTGLIIYFYIVKNRGTPTAVLATVGVVIPLSLAIPMYLVKALDVRNAAFIFALAGTGPLTPFHCLEALTGTQPKYAEKDLYQYLAYHTSVGELRADEKLGKLIQATRNEIRTKIMRLVQSVVQITILFSVLEAYSYYPFPKRQISRFWDLLYWGNICNNYLLAYATGLFLEAGTIHFGLIISLLTGISTSVVNDNPLTRTKSPSDFWGGRWNKQIHSMLKRSIYVPLRRRHFSKEFASMLTFLGSGLLHEYILVLISMKQTTMGQTYTPRLGAHAAFFAWNGGVLCLEHFIGNIQQIRRLSLPSPIQTACVLMLVLPVSHWFTDEYVSNGMLPDFAVAFPQIVWLDKSR